MYAKFDDSLITDNALIDGQHKELINRINKLLYCCEEGGGKLEAIKLLDYLSEYTDFHFNDEEALQVDIDYPGLEEHKKRHNEFRKAVEELHEMLVEEEGPSDAFVAAVKKNVVEWLYDHIKGYDVSVASFMHLKSNHEIVR